MARGTAQQAEDAQPRFVESPADDWSRERDHLLKRRIDQLGLKIEGTRLEPLVRQLHTEMETAGIDLKPPVYLADEWGCPEGVPMIGLPFYLADARLARLEKEFNEEIEAESDEDIVRYLRHEAGHAFNYAYRLFETEEWHEVFGPYSRPYRDDFEPNPFSRNFVKHIAGWYAQKHPDEDFAETFAVWLTPGLDWHAQYAGWGCMPKLHYVDRVVKELGRTPPLVQPDGYDPEGEGELAYSIEEHYGRYRHRPVSVPAYFDGDLKDLFETGPRAEGDSTEAASDFLRRHRRAVVGNIAYWTGLSDTIVRSLVDHLIERSAEMGLWLRREQAPELLTELTAYATTLCMNRLYKGDFIIK